MANGSSAPTATRTVLLVGPAAAALRARVDVLRATAGVAVIPVDRFAHLTGTAYAAALAMADEREREQLRQLAEMRARVDEAIVERALARVEVRTTDAVVIDARAATSTAALEMAERCRTRPSDSPRNRAERRRGMRRRR